MMSSTRLVVGEVLSEVSVAKLGGGDLQLLRPSGEFKLRLVIVYRGKHCPLCTRYLSELNGLLSQFQEIGVDVVAVSADSEERAQDHMRQIKPVFDIGYGLTVEQMKDLGLYISDPFSAAETDRPYAEPAVLAVNVKGELQVIDVSNVPFARPDFSTLLMGLNFTLNPSNNYILRGTH